MKTLHLSLSFETTAEVLAELDVGLSHSCSLDFGLEFLHELQFTPEVNYAPEIGDIEYTY